MAALVAATFLLFPAEALTVRLTRGGGLLWAAPAVAGSEFTLTWTHSVTLRPVSETYQVGPSGQLILREMVFDHFGPNLPSEPERGTSWRIERDRIVVTGYSERYSQLNIGVASRDHTLRIGAWQWDLIAGVGPERLVRIQSERESLLFIILSEVRQWRSTRRLP